MAKKKSAKTTAPAEEEVAEAAVEPAAETEEMTGDGQESAEAAEPSDEELLLAAQSEALANKDLYLRALADLDNYRKRAAREKEDAIRFANDNLLRNIIPVLDNLERAVEHARSAEDEQSGLLEGVEMTLEQFRKVLEAAGVEPIAALGAPFDPNFHQAMGQVPTAEQPANTVVQEMQKGYLLNERLLRPSMVMVATAPAEPVGGDDATSADED